MLDTTGLNLTISSPNNNPGLLIVNKGQIKILDRQGTTGFFICNDRFYRVIQHRNFCEIQLSQGLNTTSYVFREFKDVHDIFLFDEKIYLVSTGTNEIAVFDYNFNLVRCIKYNGSGDAWHINCLVEIDGQVFFTAFCDFVEHYSYKGKTEGSGFLMNIDTGKVVVDKLSQPHSPVYIDNKLFICDSETSRVLIYSDFNLIKEIKLVGYTRGLHVDDKYIYVGISKSRNINECSVASARIILIDRTTFQTVNEIILPVDEVYQISKSINFLDIRSLGLIYDDWDVSQRLIPLNESINLKDQELEQTKQGLQAKNQELEQAKQGLQAKDQELEQTKQGLQAKDQELEQAKQGLQAKDQELEQTKQGLQAKDQELEQTKQVLQAKDKELEQAKQWLQAKDQELEQTKQGLQAKDKELVLLYTSKSWLLTRPIRKILRLFISEKN